MTARHVPARRAASRCRALLGHRRRHDPRARVDGRRLDRPRVRAGGGRDAVGRLGANPVFEVSLAEAPSGAALLAFYRFQRAVPENDVLVSTRSGGGARSSAPSFRRTGRSTRASRARRSTRPAGCCSHGATTRSRAGPPRSARRRRSPGRVHAGGPFATGTLSDPFSASGEADLALDAFGRGTVVWQTCFSATACGSADSHRNVLGPAPEGRRRSTGTRRRCPARAPTRSSEPPAGRRRRAAPRSSPGSATSTGTTWLESARRPAATAAFGPDATVPATPDAFGPAPGSTRRGRRCARGPRRGAWIPRLARRDARRPFPGRISVTGGAAGPFVPLASGSRRATRSATCRCAGTSATGRARRRELGAARLQGLRQPHRDGDGHGHRRLHPATARSPPSRRRAAAEAALRREALGEPAALPRAHDSQARRGTELRFASRPPRPSRCAARATPRAGGPGAAA